jgi:iron complex outermembrane recepter protein
VSKPSRRRRSTAPVRANELVLMTSAILAASAAAAQQAPPAAAASSLEEVVVTAQKRTENLQTVPVSIQALDARRLEELQVTNFDSYAKYLPSLSFQTYGPGQAQLYVRGVTNGGDGLLVGSQPLVGVYLDEMPVTTIYNNLDVHIYDIQRVEALSGPQGTLFGSSSMAGTLRIITNKPNAAGFEGGYDLTANSVTAGDPGGKIEGFVNVPIADRAAIRLVGFTQHDGGYINNVTGPAQSYPTSGIPRVNTGLTKKHYNDVTTSGGRGALKLDLSDRWTVTPTAMAQRQDSKGQFAYTPVLGDLNIARYFPEKFADSWWQAALTVEGRISDFDLLYAGGYLRRGIDSNADYSDYAYFYDLSYVNTSTPTYFGDNFRDNSGTLINPAQVTISRDRYTKQSHELRISSAKERRLRAVAGLFFQRQTIDTRDEYRVQGLADQYSITNQPGLLYLNSQWRVDRDKAAFSELNYDLTDTLTATAGLRLFSYDNTVYGFFGYNGQPTYDGYVHGSGEQSCAGGVPTPATAGAARPCINIDNRTSRSGSTYKTNLTYKFDPDHMIYTTWSTGFRPGGVNRVRTRPPYTPDYLTNFEAGWKTEWFGRRVRFNGAVFLEKWKDAQFGITGLNGITEVINAGRAEIRGVEADVRWVVTDSVTLSGSVTALDAKTKTNACKYPSATLTCTEPQDVTGSANEVIAPSGSRLPVSAKWKGNLIARYQFTVSGFDGHVQAAVVGQTDVVPELEVSNARVLGNQPAYASVDFATGVRHGSWEAEFFVENALDKRGQARRFSTCAATTCTLVNVVPIQPRVVGVSVGQKF